MEHTFLNNPQIEIVSTFSELVTTEFKGVKNALCWYRSLEGDFEAIVKKLKLKKNITEVPLKELQALELSERGEVARNIILNDFKSLSDIGASPSLNLLKCYEKDDALDFIATDVYSFHVDRSPIATDTFLCTYFGASSDIIPNSQAVQKIMVPEIRHKLLELYDGPLDQFEAFLTEHYFDLHYQAQPNANITNLGLGNLWRLAVDHPQQKVLPCIHRAPQENLNQYRLLLIC